MSREAKPEERMIPITVRFTPDEYDAICYLADKYKMSKAEVVRLATDDRLIKFLGNLIYIDKEQGDKIVRLIGKTGTEIEKIRVELNRIGVNYNQELKLKNLKAKYEGRRDYEALQARIQGENDIKKGINVVSERAIKNLINRFEALTKEVGDMLCTLE